MKFMFKFFTTILALFITYNISAQHNPPQKVNSWYQFTGVTHDSVMVLPTTQTPVYYRRTGAMYFNTSDSNLYVWTGTQFLCKSCGAVPPVNNGIYDSSGTLQLGEPINTAGNPKRFFNDREIPLNGKKWTLWDTLNAVKSGYIRFNDTTHTTNGNPNYLVQINQQADTINDAYTWNEWKPRNYGYLYSGYKPNGAPARAMGWSWGYSQNSSGGLSMPDNVFGGGYNILNAVGRKDTGDASLSLRVETSFPVNGEPNFEMHWPEVTHFNGTMQRVNSWYIGKTTGITLWENNLDQQQYKSVVGVLPGTKWLEFTDNSGDYGSINLAGMNNHSIGGIINFNSLNGGSSQIRSIDGDLTFGLSGHGVVHEIDVSGNEFLNKNLSAAPPNGITIVGQNDDGSYPANIVRAQLAVVSQSKGFLPPLLTTTQKNAIPSPPEGLIVYDLTLHKLCVYTGSAWETVTSL